MTEQTCPAEVTQLAELIGPEPDEVIQAMDERASAEGFPIVGQTVGVWLSTLARLTDARRVFEFGSGFGYSAYWFARALGSDGEVVLTEIDADELDLAREYFEQGGLADRARFEYGDAIDIVTEYDGPFDIVLIDNEKERYREAFEAVRGKLEPGSVVLADNAITSSSVDRDTVVALLDGEEVPDASESSRGIADYLDYVRDQPDIETALLPQGEGVAVSVVTE
ncbi:O-methyltransferase [Halovenus marina]|uniref:O-methyltransferase n=1 Tax=Halovenus marina TaxID=3396621 RepID=UPI003F5689CD